MFVEIFVLRMLGVFVVEEAPLAFGKKGKRWDADGGTSFLGGMGGG